VPEQGGGDENGVEVTRKLRVMNGLIYDVESGVIIGEDEAAKLAPFAAVSGDAEMMIITHDVQQLAVLHLGWRGHSQGEGALVLLSLRVPDLQ